MNITLIVIAALGAACLIMTLLMLNYRLKYKAVQKENSSLKAQLIVKNQELEVMRDTEKKLREIRSKKKPDKVVSAPCGDSDSRLARLNGMQEHTDSKT